MKRLLVTFTVCALIVVDLALLMGCTQDDNRRDLWGNVLPVECRGDMPTDVLVLRVDHRAMPHGVLGLYVPGPLPIILIDDRLNRRETESATRHEKCHHIAGNFHK